MCLWLRAVCAAVSQVVADVGKMSLWLRAACTAVSQVVAEVGKMSLVGEGIQEMS